ncbi:DUF6544 family protein [Mucilaginibacter puniceus]
MSIQKIFQQAIAREKLKYVTDKPHKQISVEALPTVLKNYLKHCGYVADNRSNYCHIKWKYAYLKMAPGKKWSLLKCNQVNFFPDPARIVLFQTKLFGLFPFGAIDRFQEGKGNMLIKLLNYFTVANNRGQEMDIAELVTILAEAILIPAYFLQPYIQWEEIDPYTVKGTISHGNTSASGIFYFNEHHEFLRFETEDRYYDNKGKFEKYKWTTYAWNYKKLNGVSHPLNFMAVWNMPTMDYTYFKGRIDKITYA